MADRVSNFANAFQTTLAADMAALDTVASVVTTVGAPSSPCYLVIEPESASRREYVYFDGSFTGTTFSTTAIGNRYLTDSAAASGITHPAGSTVRVSPLAQHFIDLHDRITGHGNAVDPHPVYTTAAELGTAVANHEGAADPHAGYQREVEKGAANGYAPLGADSKVPAANLPSNATSQGFRAHRGAVQTLAAGSWTVVLFDTETRDDTASYDPATGQWTVPTTGWYDLAVCVTFAGIVDAGEYIVNMLIGGTHNTRLGHGRPGAAGSLSVVGGGPVHLTAGNVITIAANRSNAGDISGGSLLTYFTAKKA